MIREAVDGSHSHNLLEELLTVAQYHELIRAGILTEDDPVELLEGRLVTKMPKNPPHSRASRRVRKALERVVPAGWFVDSQEPVTLSDGEPEPDVMVVRGEDGSYRDHHPGPADLTLVVEVSDATLTGDRTAKLRSYARAGIPVYWILNLNDRKLEVYSQPSGPTQHPAYQQSRILGPADEVPVLIGGDEKARLAVRELLP
jgi:Uma2 family endonuclease